jgi:hypothetical protein
VSEEHQASDTQDTAETNTHEAEVEAAMRWAEVNAEPRGQLHAPDGKWNLAHFDNVPRVRHESHDRGRQMTRAEYNAYRNREQTRYAMNRPPSPPALPMAPYSGYEDTVPHGWFARLYYTMFGSYPW